VRADFFGSTKQPGEQGGGGVGEQVINVGDPPGAGELQRQQGQQPADIGDDTGAGVAGGPDQGGQVQTFAGVAGLSGYIFSVLYGISPGHKSFCATRRRKLSLGRDLADPI
jgi:hypothetical protein